MRRIALFTTFALTLQLAASIPTARGEDEVHPDDAAIVVRVKAVLPPSGTIADLARALGTEAEDTRDLGFGASWRRLALYAEDLELWVDVLGHGQDVAAVHVRSLGGSSALKERIRAEWGDDVLVHPDGIEYRFEVPAVRKRLDAAVATALGQPASGPVPEVDRQAVALLVDPLGDLTFGDVCYEDGSPPPGREAVDALRLRASIAALDVVVRGPNPEGRVYATEALLLLEREGVRLGDAIEDVIYDVLKLDVPIMSCAGCEHLPERARTLVNERRMVGAVAGSIVERIHEDGKWVDIGKVLVYWDATYVWRRRAAKDDAEAEPSWRRGRIPRGISDRLYHTFRTGAGLLVHLGTPIYVLHVEDAMSKPPPGIGELHTHLLGTLPTDDG